MRMMYRIGRPFWKTLARHGVTLKVRINVFKDDEAGVFVATSNDLPGLAVEAANLDDLAIQAKAAIYDLLIEHLHKPVAMQPVTDLRLCAA